MYCIKFNTNCKQYKDEWIVKWNKDNNCGTFGNTITCSKTSVKRHISKICTIESKTQTSKSIATDSIAKKIYVYEEEKDSEEIDLENINLNTAGEGRMSQILV